jgi:hypothetical protein
VDKRQRRQRRSEAALEKFVNGGGVVRASRGASVWWPRLTRRQVEWPHDDMTRLYEKENAGLVSASLGSPDVISVKKIRDNCKISFFKANSEIGLFFNFFVKLVYFYCKIDPLYDESGPILQ